MSSQLKSSFSISSLIQPSKNVSDGSAESKDAIVTSRTLTTQWNPDPRMMPYMAYIQPNNLVVPDTYITPPSSPTSLPLLQTFTVDNTSHDSQTFSPDASASSSSSSPTTNLSPSTEGHSESSSPEFSHRKNGRMCYSTTQAKRLENVFLTTPYPDSELYEILAEELNLPIKKLKVWFQNKRARNKRRVSDARRPHYPLCNPMYMSPVGTSLTSAVTPYPYMMPGVMTQQSVMMTPPSSPVEMQMMQRPFFPFPNSPMMHPAHSHYGTSTSGAV